jgi:hypothetical protein
MMGLTPAQWQADRPALSPDNDLVVQIWNFCDGWNPQALPLALTYFDVQNVEFILDQLILLREKIAAHEAAQREANRG